MPHLAAAINPAFHDAWKDLTELALQNTPTSKPDSNMVDIATVTALTALSMADMPTTIRLRAEHAVNVKREQCLTSNRAGARADMQAATQALSETMADWTGVAKAARITAKGRAIPPTPTAPQALPAYYDNVKAVGSKYIPHRPTRDVAKDIRADLKAAQKTGAIPADVNVSVRTRSFSGGAAIDVTLTGWDDDKIWHQETVENPVGPGYVKNTLTPQAKAIQAHAKSIVDAYNYDNSDPMTDYFEVDFYGSVDWRKNGTVI